MTETLEHVDENVPEGGAGAELPPTPAFIQGALPLADCARRIAERDSLSLIQCLRGRGRVSCQRLVELMSFATGEPWDERRVRAAAQRSCGQVLSAPGVVGYRLAAETPVSEFEACEESRYRSQIREMTRRLVQMRRAVHRRGRMTRSAVEIPRP